MAKIIGILGGMGPSATIDLFAKIVQNTPAKSDQEHLQIIINNNPQIPSRMDALQNGARSPLPELIRSAITLEKAGADFLIMPCNTAHIWLPEIRKAVNIPFYSMIENAVQQMMEQTAYEPGKILLFATETTIQCDLYQNAFRNSPFEIIVPNKSEQQHVTNAIKEVKAGHLQDNPSIPQLNEMIDRYRLTGVQMLIGGCTEIPLLFPFLREEVEKLDPTFMLATMAIHKAKTAW